MPSRGSMRALELRMQVLNAGSWQGNDWQGTGLCLLGLSGRHMGSTGMQQGQAVLAALTYVFINGGTFCVQQIVVLASCVVEILLAAARWGDTCSLLSCCFRL